ncbi:hypothetical protein SDC9_132809 [bioreactor metagenome]|uniref:Uncharacterized protein n=1 Tax=bioreactor metagenome TaxID=1076179 RepID=A0A645D9K8_9ZZZZ
MKLVKVQNELEKDHRYCKKGHQRSHSEQVGLAAHSHCSAHLCGGYAADDDSHLQESGTL